MTATILARDFLGRNLINDIAGVSDATDYLGRAVVDPSPGVGDETDYLGRTLLAAEGPS